MKPKTDYRRIKEAQERAENRRRQFKLVEYIVRKIAEALKEQEDASNFPRSL